MEKPTDQSRTAARRPGLRVSGIGRALIWPVSRFFDPRFANVAVVQNAMFEVVKDIRRMLEADMDASNEATTIVATELSHVRGLVEDLRESEHLAAGLSRSHDASVVLTSSERIVEVPYALRALASVPRGSRILVIGSAESTIAFSLASLGYDVTAADPRGYPFEHPQLHVVAGDIESLESVGDVDAIVCVSSIEHIAATTGAAARSERADLEAMARLRGLTRPGALLVLTAPFGRAGTSDTKRRYDQASLDELLEGWEVDELSFARRTSPTTWAVEESADGENVVALVTARRE